jgi:hypothetical protein
MFWWVKIIIIIIVVVIVNYVGKMVSNRIKHTTYSIVLTDTKKKKAKQNDNYTYLTLVFIVCDNNNVKRREREKKKRKALYCILIALARPFFYVCFDNKDENVFFSFYQYILDGSLKSNHSPFICTYIFSPHRHIEAFLFQLLTYWKTCNQHATASFYLKV